MDKKNEKRKVSISLILIFISLIIFELITINNINFQQNQQNNYNNNNELDKEIDNFHDYDYNFTLDSILSSGFQETTLYNASQFDVLEEAQDIIETNRYNVNDTANNFTIGLPNEWNVNSSVLDIQSIYHREQILEDNEFKNPYDKWSFNDLVLGEGSISGDWPNEEIKTNIYGVGNIAQDEFYFNKADFGKWDQLSTGLNPDGLELQIGDLIQNADEIYPIDDNFIADPGYGQDFNNPYGGVKGILDTTILEFIPGSLKCRIDPSDTPIFRGNPSIAWWTPFEIPFEADYVQISITWRMENEGFQTSDDYRVCARINNEYIDGREDIYGNTWNLNASETSLVLYNAYSEYLGHGLITRTYNITNLVNGLKGINKLDFGIWTERPNSGDDIISVYFDSIEIMANCSTKYHAASLEFDYKGIINYLDPSIQGSANENVSYFSLFCWINNVPFRIVPNSELISADSQYNHIIYNFTQYEVDILSQSTINFAIGVIFEHNMPYEIDFDVFIDNVYLYFDYKNPTPLYSGLQINQTGDWENITDFHVELNVTDWKGGQNKTIYFQNINQSINGPVFMNFTSNCSLSVYRTSSNSSTASYAINEGAVFWNVTYNNTQMYSNLITLNQTNIFNLSQYSISYLNLPAFDGNGSNSIDWNVTNIKDPNGDFNPLKLYKFNYSNNNQIAKILDAFNSGNWSIICTQPNYITSLELNGTSFYDGNTLSYNITVYNQTTFGNHSIGIYNVSDETLSYDPIYKPNIFGNLTDNWSVVDNGTGFFRFRAMWNDTNDAGQTYRIGISDKIFQIIRHTIAGFHSVSPSVASGDKATFKLYYNATFPNNNTGLNQSTITCYTYQNGTVEKWGVHWVGTYLLDSLTDEGYGNYTIKLKTAGVPKGNYSVFFNISKSFYDSQNKSSWINITGDPVKMSITLGANWNVLQNKYILWDNNTPYVNDTINSVIQVNITTLIGTPLENGQIIGQLDENVFEGIEVYALTHEVNDIGLYNITLDTTNLIVSDNETLILTGSAPGYSASNLYVNISIDPIPTMISIGVVEDIYEDGQIYVYCTFYNVIDPNNPKFNNAGDLTWFIFDEYNNHKGNGTMEFLTSGVYNQHINLPGDPYQPGIYSIKINGTASNCSASPTVGTQFEIYQKTISNLTIILPEIIRVKQAFLITALLTFSNGTPIINQLIELNIVLTSSLSDTSFMTSILTDSNGLATYEYTISLQYSNGNITVNGSYDGQYWIKESFGSAFENILGKIPAYLEIIQPPSIIRTGYPASYMANLTIFGVEDLSGKFILFSAFYDNESEAFFFKDLYTDENGICNYTIPEISDNKNNITVNFEYLGTDIISYNISSYQKTILPKWKTNILYSGLDGDIRFGQRINFEITIFSPDNSSLSYEGLPLYITYSYGGTLSIQTYYINVNNLVFADYIVADTFLGNLNILVDFSGTNKIESNSSINLDLEILDKLQPQFHFLEDIPTQIDVGKLTVSVNLTDEFSNPMVGYILIFQLIDKNGDILIYATSITNENGIAYFSVDISDVGDDYKIKIIFLEEGIYLENEFVSGNIRIVDAFIKFLDILPYILIGLVIFLSATFIVYRGIVIPKRNRHREMLKKIYQKLSDVENIQYFLILTKAGIPVFSKSFADVPIDESLVSGFLSAISSFGTEIGQKMKMDDKGGLEELSYRQFKIILNEKDYVRSAILLLKRPSEQLKYKLNLFTEKFEEQHKEDLISFTGVTFKEDPILKLIENIFEADLLYPHHIIEDKLLLYVNKLSKKDVKRKILITAKGEEFESTYYLRDIINHLKTRGIDEIKTFKGLQELRIDKIVFAINPRTNYLIEQFQPIITKLDMDDQNVLFAVFDRADKVRDIERYLKKHSIIINKEIEDSISKLYTQKLISEENVITEMGEIIATLLKLIPELISKTISISSSELISIPKEEIVDDIKSIKTEIKKLEKQNKLEEAIQLMPRLLKLYNKKGDFKKANQILAEQNKFIKIILQSRRDELIKLAIKAENAKEWQKAADIFSKCKEISFKLYKAGNLSEDENIKIFTTKQDNCINELKKKL